jgi:hypothetical protein
MTLLDSFCDQVVADLGGAAPLVTVPILEEWSRYEIGDQPIEGRWNPWNTTTKWPGSVAMPGNDAGVQNYPSLEVGVAATVATLRNGYYPAIVRAIQEGWTLRQWANPAVIAEINTWGTHGFAEYLTTLAPSPAPAPEPSPPPAPAPQEGFVLPQQMKNALVRLAYLSGLGRQPESGSAELEYANDILDDGSNADEIMLKITGSPEGQIWQSVMRGVFKSTNPPSPGGTSS